MLRLSICISLIITLGLALTACGGGGGSGGGSSAVPTTPVTSVTINGTTFNLASCYDFSTTPGCAHRARKAIESFAPKPS